MHKTNFKRFLSVTLAVVMLAGCLATGAFAAEIKAAPVIPHPESTMSPTVNVYPIETHTFYKVTGTVVTYADRDDGTGWTAIPSTFLAASEYNVNGIAYGMYVTSDGAVHYVDMTLCYEKDNAYTWYHGTQDSATVSSDVDKATNEDNTMGTNFYVNIDKDAIDPEGTTEETVVVSATEDPRVAYEITVSTKATYQLDVTVPLYVCMYGFGGDGNIIEPSADVYKLLNYSTANDNTSAEIVDITKITHYTKIFDANHSNEELFAIAYNKTDGSYQWWYSAPSGTLAANFVYYVLPADAHINASGECYVIYIDDAWSFKTAGVLEGDALKETVAKVEDAHQLSEKFLYGPEDCWDFGKAPAVGDKKTGGTAVGMPVQVSRIQAQPHTWKLIGVDTPVKSMKRGELAMSIAPTVAKSNASAIDLSDITSKTDITERGWVIAAPTPDDKGKVSNPTSLGMILKAQMAGGAVNDSSCTSVVTVNYTVIPQFMEKSVQTNSVDASAVNSNYAK